MKIGEITLKNNLILAPMAGFSVPALRRIAAENGAGLTVTEMISVKGLLFGSEKTVELLKTAPAETIKCVQLFGREPKDFYDCLHLPALQNFDIIDINMGCPVKKIVSNGEGSALMDDGGRAAEIVAAVKSAITKKTGQPTEKSAAIKNDGQSLKENFTNRPNQKDFIRRPGAKNSAAQFVAVKSAARAVTVKTRLAEGKEGLPSVDKTLEFLLALQCAGADMIVLHARTPRQMYSGAADYALFDEIKRKVSLPVALSGDITDAASYKRAAATGADFLMIGRGAVANPMIFNDLLSLRADGQTAIEEQVKTSASSLKTNSRLCGKSGKAGERAENKQTLVLRLMEYMRQDFGADHAVKVLRKFLPYLLKGEKCNKEQRHKMNFIEDFDQLQSSLIKIFSEMPFV